MCQRLFTRLFTASVLIGAAIVLSAGGFATSAPPGKQPAAGSPEKNYDAAIWNELHFPPAIDNAKDEQCLSCHQEILKRKPRAVSPAGVKGDDAIAWYQVLATYSGDQQSFHWRHIQSPYAKDVMKLTCNFCHRGHDPREEAPGASATGAPQGSDAGFALRKVVDPATTCLRCHGKFPYEIMELPGPWHEVRESMESEDAKNGCLAACHQDAFRTNRHQVTYLNASRIEEIAKESSDVCFGCHGGRSWYRISYPYPRNPWPDMDAEVPEWAKDRPTQSEARYRIEKGPSADSKKP